MDYWTRKLFNVLMIIVSVHSQEVFNTMPPPVNTSFTCRGRDTGFYADVETNCRVYHTCDDHGNKFTYYCPEETAFRQEALVCDHARLVDCAKGRGSSTMDKNNQGKTEDNAYSRSSHVDSSFDEARNHPGTNVDFHHRSGNRNPSYTRSFRITAEPTSNFPTPRTFEKKQPTFVLNSSVFLRDRGNYQKPSTVSRDNRVVIVGSKNFDEKIDDKQKKDGNGDFYGQSSSTTVATTLKPRGANFEGRMNFGQRNFGKNGKDSGFRGGFTSPTYATTFRPSGTNPKGNFGSTVGSGVSNFDRKDVTSRFSGISSSMISATTFEPHGRDFKVMGAGRNPSDFGHRNSNVNNGNGDGFSSVTSSTTLRPFGAGFKVQKSSGDVPNFSSVPFDKRGGNSEMRMTSGRYDQEEIKPLKEGQFENKRRNDQKMEFTDFRSQSKNNGDPGASEGARGGSLSGDARGFEKNNDRPSSFFDSSNFPYSATLISMQDKTSKTIHGDSSKSKTSGTKTISSPVTTAGTEFPVPSLAGLLSPVIPNDLEDDPYYPKRSTTTEAYYKLHDRDEAAKRRFKFSTRSPWPGSLDFEIPEVLPDLNTLDDLVDRRKLFYIPRVKTN